MIRKLVDNYENYIKYTKYYIVVVSILFLIFGHGGDNNNNEILQLIKKTQINNGLYPSNFIQKLIF